jgi:pyruvate dehydrogenase E2 component (dihydrolipoamide acetyltransferase)
MAIRVVMPALEMAQETGKLVSWRKQQGQTVAKGEPLLEIETDKAVMEIEAPGDGVLAAVKAQPGDEVPVGQTIAWLVQPGEAPPTEEAPAASGRHMSARPANPHLPTAADVGHEAAASAPSNATPAAAPPISPKARRLAKEHGIDLSKVRGTGPGGEILGTDILAFAKAGSAAPPSVAAAPASAGLEALSSTAKLMAERTTKSWTTVPHFFLVREIDAGALLAARDKLLPQIEKARGVRLTQTDLLVALLARVLVKHPRVNAMWAEGGIRLNQEINVGIAMAVEDAVVATVVRYADKTELAEIAVQRRYMAERARAGRLQPSDIAGATFTISNLGMYNVDAFSAIISPPQAAILAVGRITDRVVPVEGKPGVRPMMTLTLSSDHRVVDGARAARFLDELAAAIAEPEKWLAG